MVQAFAVLLVCQLMGEGIVHLTSVPVPGPVIGLILLAAALTVRERSRGGTSLGESSLGRAANGLLGQLSLLFVPAAVGIVQQGHVLAANGLANVVALLVSTVLTLAVTAAVFIWAARRFIGEERA